MKKYLAIFFVLVFCGNVFSQVKWSQAPIIKPLGIYQKLPIAKNTWENPNKQPIVYMTPAGVLAVGANFRVLPNSNEQDELYLSYNPAWPNVMFGSANTTVGSTYGQGVYVTTNGGVTWYGTDLMPNEPSSTSDPGPAIDKNGTFVFTSLNTGGTAFMYSQYSTNFGVNWSSPITIYASSSDKNLTASDDVPSSPYYGRTYTAWTQWSGSYPILASYTTNGGVSWSTAQAVNSPTNTSQGADVVVGPNPAGVVYICWSKQSSVSIGVGFSKSTNGGVSWITNETAFASNGTRDNSNFGGWGVRVNDFPRIAVDKSGGPRNGWIYIVDDEKNLSPAGSDADVILHKSTDGGTTWSAGVRVNQDLINNGKLQFFPVVCVDGSGGVNVLYYDNRNYASLADSCETYMSRSIDGGVTWTDIKVSDHRWKPVGEGGSGTYMGDYIGLAFAAGKLWPFWFDNKTGHMQAWTAPIDVGPSITHTPLGNTELITGTIPVNCVITPSGSGINPSLSRLYYRLLPATAWTLVQLTNTSGTNWAGNITLGGAGTYNYYLTATDSLSRTVTAPGGAPTNFYSFSASADTVKPVIVHTPIPNTPKQSWPVSVSATVTDNIGIDSVWVRWYKNTVSNYKQFKLLFTSGNNYTALFNSVNSDVTPGDTIKYRVIAQDNSSAHNRDSTALYAFAITNVVTTNACRTVWVPIRDNATSYDSFQLGTHTNIIKVNFTMVQLIHTYDGDVTFALRSPLGTEVILSANHGSSGDNYINTVFNDSATTAIASGTAPFTGTFRPDNVLSAFNGQDPYGWWRLRVTDNAGGDTGHVGQYCVQIFAGSIISGTNNLSSKIPEVYSLKQNYPNPFNPVTKINFDIPKQGFVNLKIYDVLGREVKVLVNEVKSPGSYSIDFNGTELSSGVYFYRMESNGFTDVKKMMLIK
jgi:subtilisin-like proprotein convertase family protein